MSAGWLYGIVVMSSCTSAVVAMVGSSRALPFGECSRILEFGEMGELLGGECPKEELTSVACDTSQGVGCNSSLTCSLRAASEGSSLCVKYSPNSVADKKASENEEDCDVTAKSEGCATISSGPPLQGGNQPHPCGQVAHQCQGTDGTCGQVKQEVKCDECDDEK